MDRTNSQTLSEIRDNDTLFDSQYTHLTGYQVNHNWFSEQKIYSKAVLSTWGLNFGQMSYSKENEQTLRCMLQLITYHQKDLQFRTKVKQDMTSLSFQKDKYRSFMQQAQRNFQEVTRRLGKYENELTQMKNRQKKGEITNKKQKEQDKKMIAMLKAKNEQIIHQMKKKQQQVHRIKERMKKSVGQKTIIARNSFEVFENLSPNKKQENKSEQVKYSYMIQRNQKEMANLFKENSLLRDKIFEIREQLINFNIWIDRYLFGQDENDHYKKKIRFPFNHNLIFKKQSLTEELIEMIEISKDGIRQLRHFYVGNEGQQGKKSQSCNIFFKRQQIEDLDFKKKMKKVGSIESDRFKVERQAEDDKQQKQISNKKNTFGKAMDKASQNVTPKSLKKIEIQQQKNFKIMNPKNVEKINSYKIQKERFKFQPNKAPFDDQFLSDNGDGQESSIVSHIEVQKLGKNRFDKWDILYNDDDQ